MIDYQAYCSVLLEDLQRLVRIPSVYDASTVAAAMPYGKNVSDGLAFMRERALADGFEVRQFDGQAIAIVYHPGGARVDVVSHVDVVEPGIGWDFDPFGAQVVGNRLYGRGTQDMKASLMLTYYALKIIREHWLPVKKELRVVVGCDEERTMDDIIHYIRCAGEPSFAFTPDGFFPLQIGEKGALMWRLRGSMESCIEELSGGVQCNVVPPVATCTIRSSALQALRTVFQNMHLKGSVGLQSAHGESRVLIQVEGRSAHASVPHQGINAIILMCTLVARVTADPLATLVSTVFGDCQGGNAGLACDIQPMGKLTLNLGVLRVDHGQVYGEIDCRYPHPVDSRDLTCSIAKACLPLAISLDYDSPPVLHDPDSPPIRALLDTYRKVTGDTASPPVISGGVSYSKVIANCVAFGPHLAGLESLAHKANEYFPIDQLPMLLELYTRSMVEVASLDA